MSRSEAYQRSGDVSSAIGVRAIDSLPLGVVVIAPLDVEAGSAARVVQLDGFASCLVCDSALSAAGLQGICSPCHWAKTARENV